MLYGTRVRIWPLFLCLGAFCAHSGLTEAEEAPVAILQRALTRDETARWLAEALRQSSRADVAIVKSDVLAEAGLAAGPLLRTQLMTALGYADDEVMAMDTSLRALEEALCKSEVPLQLVGGELTREGGRCRLQAKRKGRELKVALPARVAKNSREWLGKDFSGKVFKMGYRTERAVDAYLKKEGIGK